MARPSGIPGQDPVTELHLSPQQASASTDSPAVFYLATGWWPSVLLPVEGLENPWLLLFWFILLMCRRAEKNKPRPLFVSIQVSSWFLLGDSVSASCWVSRRSWRYLSLRYLRQPQSDGGLPFTDSKDSSLTSLAARWQLLASLFLLTPGLGTQREPHQPIPKILFSYLCLPFLTPGRWEEERLQTLGSQVTPAEAGRPPLPERRALSFLAGAGGTHWVSPPGQDTLAWAFLCKVQFLKLW